MMFSSEVYTIRVKMQIHGYVCLNWTHQILSSDTFCESSTGFWLTCMSLVVFQHVDLLGKLAVTLLTLVLFDALVKLHVVPQSVLGLHACTGNRLLHMAMIQTSAAVCSCAVYTVRNEMWWNDVCDAVRDPDLFHTLHTGSLGYHREPWGAPSACPSSQRICYTCHSCDSSPLDGQTRAHRHSVSIKTETKAF